MKIGVSWAVGSGYGWWDMNDSPPPAPEHSSPPPLPSGSPAADLTQPQPPPFMAAPAAGSQFAPERQSSRVVMYVGIGCGLLALMAIVGLVFGVGWGVRKVGTMVTEIQANPEKFAAEMVVKADPNLELITSNDATGEITFRNKASGETLTISYAEVAKGNLSVTTTGPDGTTMTRFGSWQGAPAWFPVMDGMVTSGAEMRTTTGQRETIHLTATTAAATEDVVVFYTDELDALGFTITRHSQTAGSLVNERIEADDASGGRRVTLNITRPEADAQAGLVVTIESPVTP